jgi:hypothetical protein
MNVQFKQCVPRCRVKRGRARLAFAALFGVMAFAQQAVVAARAEAAAGAAAAASSYEPASARAAPGLQCNLYPTGEESATGVPVFTDDDGYARFYAMPPNGAHAVSELTLDCTDAAGKPSSYAVDLGSATTFAPNPLDLSTERGTDRPALKGDPMTRTQAELIQAGYGLRPDPAQDPHAYARWLAAASTPGRLLEAKRPDLHSHTTTSTSGAPWVGSALTGSPDYVLTEAVFNVPSGVPGGDHTTKTEIAIWNGLGGFGTGSGLIQGGVNVYTTPTIAAYGSWREYCCGDTDSNGYGGAFTPSPGDQIFSQEWYCDSKGNPDLNGGYGCTYLMDEKSGAILDCTLPGGKPCWSVKALPQCSVKPVKNCMTLGRAAEFVIENQSPQVSSSSTAFTDFRPGVTMAGTATNTLNKTKSISNDPDVNVLTDFTHTTTHILVTLAGQDDTDFNVEATQSSFPLYCHGPLKTTGAPGALTEFKWATKGADAQAPGEGECAWADRAPRGSEIKSGDTNTIWGYLNQLTNLPKGKYGEIEVYRDPNHDNDLVLTQIVGFVSPPF